MKTIIVPTPVLMGDKQYAQLAFFVQSTTDDHFFVENCSCYQLQCRINVELKSFLRKISHFGVS